MKFNRLSTLLFAATLVLAMAASTAGAMAQQQPYPPPPGQQQPYPPPGQQQQPYPQPYQQQPYGQQPGGYQGCNEVPGRTIVGTVVYFYAFDLRVRGCDGRRYRIHLHQGTIIWPTGITLEPGMPVAVNGRYVGPYGMFEAFRIVVRRY
ncbi:MAG TPA: hypothetical protein VIN40_09935 [Candidatus Tyrphobacter sp.]